LLKIATLRHVEAMRLVCLKIANVCKNQFQAIATGQNWLQPVKSKPVMMSFQRWHWSEHEITRLFYAYLSHQH